MALDAFLKIKDIPGESADEAHKDYIEVLGYSLGMTAPTNVATGIAAGRCRLSPLTIQKVVDKASALLAKACGTNQILNEVTLELCRATGKKEKYWEYTLSKVRVSGLQAGKKPSVRRRFADGGGELQLRQDQVDILHDRSEDRQAERLA